MRFSDETTIADAATGYNLTRSSAVRGAGPNTPKHPLADPVRADRSGGTGDLRDALGVPVFDDRAGPVRRGEGGLGTAANEATTTAARADA